VRRWCAATTLGVVRIDIHRGGNPMQWQTPSYNDIRFGFEVTMYINNR